MVYFFQVFKKYGVMKYDPANEQFDPNKHMAIFQVPSLEKQPGTVAAVLKVSSKYFCPEIIAMPL